MNERGTGRNWRKYSFAIVACIAQAAIVWAGSLILIISFGAIVGDKSNLEWVVLDYILFGLAGMGCALLAVSIEPAGAESGSWIWSPAI